MLAPDDRAVLREHLRPEPGDRLDLAIGTTFTLDLTAALVVPLAFAAYDITGAGDPIAVLEAVRNVVQRVDVFCQVGQMRVPPSASDLMAFLEPMVHEVQAPVPGFLFHPKVWILRYRTVDDDVRFRFVCATRNLTDDVAWDVAVRLDGRSNGRRAQAVNRPLVDLLRALPAMSVRGLDEHRHQRIVDLADDIATVEWELPTGVKDLRFHLLGLHRARRPGPLAVPLAGRRHLAVSPFLDDDGVALATDGRANVVLVSRPEALDRLTPETLEGMTCRIISPMAGIAQPDEDDQSMPSAKAKADSLLGGLHAKLYVIEAGRQARVLIGSANATAAGLGGRNVEVVVELTGGPKALGVDRFLDEQTGFASILEPYEPVGGLAEPPEETIGRQLEKVLRNLASRPLTAHVAGRPGAWTETVTGLTDVEIPDDVSVRVALLTLIGRAVVQDALPVTAAFDGLSTADITPFVVLQVSHRGAGVRVERSTVVRAELIGDPPDRLDEVIARQVDTPEKFLRFLALLLGLADDPFLAVAQGGGGTGAWSPFVLGRTGLFELVVRAVADRPQAVEDLDRLVERLESTELGRKIFPLGFQDLWATIRSARDEMAAR